MTIAAPDLHAQRLDHLVLANQVRSSRSRLKRDLNRRHRPPTRTLLDPPERARGMPILALLCAMPGIGKTKAERALFTLGIQPDRRVGRLKRAQREQLLELLRDRHPVVVQGWEPS